MIWLRKKGQNQGHRSRQRIKDEGLFATHVQIAKKSERPPLLHNVILFANGCHANLCAHASLSTKENSICLLIAIMHFHDVWRSTGCDLQ